MGNEYSELRRTIYTTDSELKRFRSVLVNSVLSTDIVNKDLKNLRNERWKMAFGDHLRAKTMVDNVDQYRATCILEHLIQVCTVGVRKESFEGFYIRVLTLSVLEIQASDVSHTMQHWHVYRYWNECLFEEMYLAYKEGRSDQDPSLSWYEGELGFFDFYIIPLAKKLEEVGAFGVSSSEYLDFALKNRTEWQTKGRHIVASMLLKLTDDGGVEC